jgi:hypothetical protein
MNSTYSSNLNLNRFFSNLILLYFFIYIQSYFFAKFSTPWMHIDFVTILILFLCFEHNFLSSLFFCAVGGILIHVFSSAPTGIFIIYYLLCSVLSNTISTIFLLNSMNFKFIFFCFLYLFKYLIIYLSLNNKNAIDFLLLILLSWQSIFITLISGFFLFQILHRFDNLLGYFHFSRKKRLGRYA